MRYHYQDRHLDAITEGNQHWQFAYNDQGDCVRIESPTGEVTQRTYDSEHRLLSETHYQAFDGNHQPIKPQTTRFLYDPQGHLRYEISPDGAIKEHRYDAQGNRINSRCYRFSRWLEQSSLAPTGLSTTHYVYDGLGRLIQTIDNQNHTQAIEYDDAHQRVVKTDANGLQTISIFDKSGLLLSTQRLDLMHAPITAVSTYVNGV